MSCYVNKIMHVILLFNVNKLSYIWTKVLGNHMFNDIQKTEHRH